jgi:hypothetical protein
MLMNSWKKYGNEESKERIDELHERSAPSCAVSGGMLRERCASKEETVIEVG